MTSDTIQLMITKEEQTSEAEAEPKQKQKSIKKEELKIPQDQ
jgi:hypothetical protein